MSDEDPILITLSGEDMQRIFNRIMDAVPYETPGQLRDAVFNGGELCCPGCYDYTHPHANAWREMHNWLFLADEDWRTVE